MASLNKATEKRLLEENCKLAKENAFLRQRCTALERKRNELVRMKMDQRDEVIMTTSSCQETFRAIGQAAGKIKEMLDSQFGDRLAQLAQSKESKRGMRTAGSSSSSLAETNPTKSLRQAKLRAKVVPLKVGSGNTIVMCNPGQLTFQQQRSAELFKKQITKESIKFSVFDFDPEIEDRPFVFEMLGQKVNRI